MLVKLSKSNWKPLSISNNPLKKTIQQSCSLNTVVVHKARWGLNFCLTTVYLIFHSLHNYLLFFLCNFGFRHSQTACLYNLVNGSPSDVRRFKANNYQRNKFALLTFVFDQCAVPEEMLEYTTSTYGVWQSHPERQGAGSFLPGPPWQLLGDPQLYLLFLKTSSSHCPILSATSLLLRRLKGWTSEPRTVELFRNRTLKMTWSNLHLHCKELVYPWVVTM